MDWKASPTHHKLPTLYKKTSTGAAQQWSVKVFMQANEAIIESTYGQVDGALQSATEIVREGKNIGRANETTILDQAKSQAASLWQKKLDKGYLENLDEINSGGANADIRPMLAKSFEDREDKLIIGASIYLQPKLDGIRCIAKKENGKVGLFSRNGKPITATPHIAEELKVSMKDGEIWDGELYHPKLEFNEITALTRTKEPTEGSEQIEYHIFDVVADGTYEKRFATKIFKLPDPSHLKLVEVVPTTYNRQVIDRYHKIWTKQGYEGLIIRLAEQKKYEQKRTSALIKYKTFLDDEFKIVGYEEGTPGSKLDGALSAFILEIKTENGIETFKAKPDGSLEQSKKLWEEREQWIGKKVKTKFQALSKYGIPRFPIIVGLRWENDL